MISLEAYRSRIGAYLSVARCITMQSKHACHNEGHKAARNTGCCFSLKQWLRVLVLILILSVSFYTNYQQLLQDGDVESNPGPADITKLLFGSFNKGDSRFGQTSGLQCACNSLISVCWSSIKRVSVWKSWDLDHILNAGDLMFEKLGLLRSLSLEELPNEVHMYGQKLQVTRLKTEHGMLSSRGNIDFLSESIKNFEELGNGALLMTNGYTCAIIWAKLFCYIFDSQSHKKNGLESDCGYSTLLKFKYIASLQEYIRGKYLCNVEEMQYDMQYIKIETTTDAIHAISKATLRARDNERKNLKRKQVRGSEYEILAAKAKRQRDKEYYKNVKGAQKHEELKKRWREYSQNRREILDAEKYTVDKERMRQYSQNRHRDIIGTEKHAVLKESMRQRSQVRHDNIIGTEKHADLKENMRQRSRARHDNIIGTEKHTKLKECMRQYSHIRRNTEKRKDFRERIANFNKFVKQGPCYVCVSCNRCHYFKSFVQFYNDKYQIQRDDIFTIVTSFDGKQYICHTCHRKLLKGIIPCQAIRNKLQVFHLPNDISDLRKLEKAIISKRILFKKVAIMPKGQMPKVKGAICNVPVDTNEVYKVIPRASDSTGIVLVKLKRKLMYNGHVLFEPVRPDKIRRILEYLKENNPFYHDIEIDVSNIDSNLLSFEEDDVTDEDLNAAEVLLEEREDPLREH